MSKLEAEQLILRNFSAEETKRICEDLLRKVAEPDKIPPKSSVIFTDEEMAEHCWTFFA